MAEAVYLMPSSSSSPAICPLQVETRLDVKTSCKEPEGSQRQNKAVVQN